MPELSPEERKAASEQRRKTKQRQALEDAELVAIMQMQLGRNWIWRQLALCGVFRSPFGNNPHMSYFAGGEQNVGLRILAELVRVCPDLYTQMMMEHSREYYTQPNTVADSGTDPGAEPDAYSDSGTDSYSGSGGEAD